MSLTFGEHRIGPDRLEERRVAVEAMRPARERRREIEPEAVDAAGLDPMAQRVHDHRTHHRMREIERIPAAGEILVEARLRRP